MVSIENAAEPDAWFKLDRDVLRAGRALDHPRKRPAGQRIRALNPGAGAITIDASQIERLDCAGAWLLLRTRRALEAAGHNVSSFKLPELYQPLMENLDRDKGRARRSRRGAMSLTYRLERIGRATMDAGQQGWRMLGYLGRVTVETGERSPRRAINLRFAAMMHQVEETGISALPIVGPARLPDRRGAGLSGRRPVEAFRRGSLHHQSSGRGHAARDRRPDHRHHRGGPLRLGLHRPYRHHARQ